MGVCELQGDTREQRQTVLRTQTSETLGSRDHVLVTVGLYFIATSLAQSLAPMAAVRAGLDGLELGVVVMLVGGGLGLATDVGFGLLGDRVGLWKVALFGLLIGALACTGVAFVASGGLLIVAALIYGIGNSAVGAPLLALLSRTTDDLGSKRTQGFNGAVQRLGALIAALIVGAALEKGRVEVVGIAASAALLAAGCWMAAGWRRSQTGTGRDVKAYPRVADARKELVMGYRRALRLARGRPLIAAAMVNIALGTIFVSTNGFIPLDGSAGHAGKGVWVAASLGCRDIAAIGAALAIAYGPERLISRAAIVLSLASAVLGALGVALLSGRTASWETVLWCAFLGLGVGVGVAATNLLAISGSAPFQRATGMAASGMLNRLAGIAISIFLGWCFGAGGVTLVFIAVAVIIGALALYVGALLSPQPFRAGQAVGHAGQRAGEVVAARDRASTWKEPEQP